MLAGGDEVVGGHRGEFVEVADQSGLEVVGGAGVIPMRRGERLGNHLVHDPQLMQGLGGEVGLVAPHAARTIINAQGGTINYNADRESPAGKPDLTRVPE